MATDSSHYFLLKNFSFIRLAQGQNYGALIDDRTHYSVISIDWG